MKVLKRQYALFSALTVQKEGIILYTLHLVLNADFYKKLDNVILCNLAFYPL